MKKFVPIVIGACGINHKNPKFINIYQNGLTSEAIHLNYYSFGHAFVIKAELTLKVNSNSVFTANLTNPL